MTVGIPFGKYLLTRRLARGGMAEVFLAIQRGPAGFERTVALKRILPHLADSAQFLEMFMEEARLAAQLSHANIAHIYEFGAVEDSYFIAMEYIDGIDLSAVVLEGDRHPIPLEHAARIVADVCAGLHYAHQLKGKAGKPFGLVHRDISPQNILVSFDGAVKVVDFGIAKAAHHIERTKPGVVRGKFSYMSPEQVMGKPLDARSDLFSAGIVLYELCAARPLFPRTDAVQAMQRIRKATIPELKRGAQALPAPLAKILRRSLTRDRDARYASAAEMQLDLEEYLRHVSQMSNSIVLGQYFKEHYRQLRPVPAQGADSAQEQQTHGTPPAERRPATVPWGHGPGGGSSPSGTLAVAGAQGVPPASLVVDGTRRDQSFSGRNTVVPGISSAAAADEGPTLVDLGDHPTRISISHSVPGDSGDEEYPTSRKMRGERDELSGVIHDQLTGAPLRGALGPAFAPEAPDPDPTVDEIEAPTMQLATGPAATVDRLPDSAPTLNLERSHAGAASTTAHVTPSRRWILVISSAVLALMVTVAAVVGLTGTPKIPPGEAVTGLAGAGIADSRSEPLRPPAAEAPDAAPADRKGILVITSRPAGAFVFLNGRELPDVTPLQRSVTAGTYRARVEREGFDSQVQDVTVLADDSTHASFVLRRAPAPVASGEEAPDASAPPTVTKPAISKQPRTDSRRQSKIKRSPTTTRPRPARPHRPRRQPAGHGFLSITTIPWSTAYIDGRRIGMTPLANVRLPAGSHRVKLVNPSLPPLIRTIRVSEGKVTKLNLRLK